MIVTGDPTQIDLPPGQKSGLIEAVRILSGVEGIAHVIFREPTSCATTSCAAS